MLVLFLPIQKPLKMHTVRLVDKKKEKLYWSRIKPIIRFASNQLISRGNTDDYIILRKIMTVCFKLKS